MSLNEGQKKTQKHRNTNTETSQCSSCGANLPSCKDLKPIDVAKAANGTPIYIYRILVREFSLGNRSFCHKFYEANTDHNILGMDFIEKHVKNIDIENMKLIFNEGETIEFVAVESQPQISSIKLDRKPALVDDSLINSESELGCQLNGESVQSTDQLKVVFQVFHSFNFFH